MATGQTTNWKRPYPLETDTPDVAADVGALANSLDKWPLYPTTATASRSLVAGESALANPSTTLTLPSAPSQGDAVRVVPGSAVTGSAQVTVAASGGKVINGKGLSAASSFVLGIPFAFVTLQYDGTAWQIVEGQRDTGWVPLTLSTGWAATSGTWVPAARLCGDSVAMRGQATGSSPGSSIAHLTAPFIPSVITGAGSPTIPVLVFHGVSSTPTGGAVKYFDSTHIDLQLGATPVTSDSVGLGSVRYTV